MKLHRLPAGDAVGRTVAGDVAQYLREVVEQQGQARIVLATGTSQLGFLAHLVEEPEIDWSAVTMFHLDEYIGLPSDHPAGFRRYLRERFVDRVHPGAAVLIDGEAEPQVECRRLAALISAAPIDAACVGIGENGHLAFNDPPADFETDEPFIVVELDHASRRQQVGEGWFERMDDVPQQAITMSIRQIMRSRKIFAIAPEERKAKAVQACLEGEVSPLHPASILQRHPDMEMYLDRASASLLTAV